jgi:hypothetical protein
MDETNWKMIPNDFAAWSKKGREFVHGYLKNNVGEGLAVFAFVTGTVTKLPLSLIGKGKPSRRLKHYEFPGEVWTATSETAWSNETVICEFLTGLRRVLYSDGHDLVLVMETYSAYRTAQAKEFAYLLKIPAIYIPRGCTDLCQPLDRRIFEILKSYPRQYRRQNYYSNTDQRVIRRQMAQ